MEKARMIVLTDIGPWTGEPDDAQSLVRLLLYANEYDIEGIIPNASWCGPDTSDEGYMTRIHDVVNAYEKVVENLEKHAKGYPTAEYLRSRVKRGTSFVNMKKRVSISRESIEACKADVEKYRKSEEYNVGEGLTNEGAELIRAAIEKQDTRPLWITLWGGCGTLAQAIYDMAKEYTRDKMRVLLSKLCVYDIDGQDDCGAWIMHRYPEITWLRSDVAFWGFSETPKKSENRAFPKNSSVGDLSTVSPEWVSENIQAQGPLGKVYPLARQGLETDSPSFLFLLNNGLQSYLFPHYGGWGGRFTRTLSENVPAEHFTATQLCEDSPFYMYRDDVDTYWDKECGMLHRKNMLATIGRWRTAYQNDMAARMQWSLTPNYKEANHNPVAIVNGDKTKDFLYIDAKPGDEVLLNASDSFDPDGDSLSFRYYTYPEAGTYHYPVRILGEDSAMATVYVPENAFHEEIHIILEVSEKNRKMPLTAYRRIIIRTGETGLDGERQDFFNDTDFTYTGEWEYLTDQYGSHNRDIHISDKAGAEATLSFYGNRVMLFGGAFSDNGIASMEIDGKPVEECDFYSCFPRWESRYSFNIAITTGDTVQWLSPYLGEGRHTLRITVLGKHNDASSGDYVVIDRAVAFL